jgi:hypothetical protein
MRNYLRLGRLSHLYVVILCRMTRVLVHALPYVANRLCDSRFRVEFTAMIGYEKIMRLPTSWKRHKVMR